MRFYARNAMRKGAPKLYKASPLEIQRVPAASWDINGKPQTEIGIISFQNDAAPHG